MRTLSSAIQQDMHKLSQRGNWRRLYKIVEDSSTTRFLTDHVATITYNSDDYDPYPITIGERSETSRPEFSPFEISVANIDQSFVVGLENGGYRGQRITVTEVFIDEDGTVEVVVEGVFRISDAEVSPDTAFVTFNVGMPNLFSQAGELPRHRWLDERCPFAYRDPERCAYLQDEFLDVTEMDLLIGGDDVKIQGWRFLNSSTTTTADINISNADHLTMVIGTGTNVSPNRTPPDAPFLYKLLDVNEEGMSTDFDVQIETAGSITEDFEGEGILVTEDADSPTDFLLVGKRWGVQTGGVLGTYGQQYGDGAPTSYFTAIDSSNRHLRLTKVGSLFSAYERLDEDSSWTLLGTKDRPDMEGVSLRLGVYAETGSNTRSTAFTSQIDFFRVTDGGFTDCNRLITDCRQRENTRRFGGAPGILHGPLEL